MPAYRLCGLIVQSNFPLPELPAASGEPCCSFALEEPGRAIRHHAWYHHWRSAAGRRQLSFARSGQGHLLRFPGVADFEIERGGAIVRAIPRRETPRPTLRHLLLNQVWPLVLSGRGDFVLHASAVVLPDGSAIALAGTAGVGKSSLAVALARRGSRLLSDDCLLVERTGGCFHAIPSYPGVRLWPDMVAELSADDDSIAELAHYTSKKRVDGRGLVFSVDPAPLAAVYVVRPASQGSTIRLAPIRGAAALMQLVPFTYLLDHEDPRQLERSFVHLGALSANVPVRGLDMPHEAHRLGCVAEVVMTDASAGRLP